MKKGDLKRERGIVNCEYGAVPSYTFFVFGAVEHGVGSSQSNLTLTVNIAAAMLRPAGLVRRVLRIWW